VSSPSEEVILDEEPPHRSSEDEPPGRTNHESPDRSAPARLAVPPLPEKHAAGHDQPMHAGSPRARSRARSRARIWSGVPDNQWEDWRWQLSHRLNTLEELSQIIHLTPEEEEGCRSHNFRLDITPYFASLIHPEDPNCPIRRQVIPTAKEAVAFGGMFADSLNEDGHSPVPGLVHRYPDRVLMLVTTQCASYCRYCTRSRIVGSASAQFSRADFDAQIEYIARTPQVRDVLLSGGDPLILPQRILEDLLRRLRAIPHVEIIRIGSRVPVFLPQRITEELVAMLRQFHPLWMNLHFNHAAEITPEVTCALARLADAGLPLGSQTVLLAGINDSPAVMKELLHKLVRNRVRPYYLYQCDLVEGAGHFRTTISKGIEIIESLRGHTSGYAIPTYVVDAPGGGGKIPVMPQYVISQAPGKVILRNFEGFITTYNEPLGTDYTGHTVARPEQPVINLEAGQEGVAGMLAGVTSQIKPEGFDRTHERLGQGTSLWTPEAEPHKGVEWDPFEVELAGVRRSAKPGREHNPDQG
jgi:lysine 2,3-aminomutase